MGVRRGATCIQRRGFIGITARIVFLIGVAVAARSANAATRYVDGAAPWASDSNPGTSALPLKTIQSGINKSAAGDTVIVRPATYYGGVVLNKAIVLRGEPGAKITTYNVGSGTGIDVRSNDCTIQGFRIEYFAMGIAAFSAPRSNVRVFTNHTYACQFHCWINGTNWLVQNNEFERCIWWDKVGDSDYTRMFGSDHVFRGNYIHGTIYPTDIAPAEGSTDYAHNDGIQYYGNGGQILHNIRVEENYFTDFHQGIFWADEWDGNSIQGAIIKNNVFWGQTYVPPPGTNLLGLPSWGVLIGKYYGGSDIQIKNNVFYHIANYLGLRAWTVATVKKNIVVGAGAGTVYVLSGNTQSNVNPGNILWRFASYGDLYSQLDQELNPLLRDPSRPLGVDGIVWTPDDGWRPTSPSALGFGPLIAAPAPIDDQSIWVDTDGDGVFDLTEEQLGTDPLNPLEFPILPLRLGWVCALGAAIGVLGGATLVRALRRPQPRS